MPKDRGSEVRQTTPRPSTRLRLVRCVATTLLAVAIAAVPLGAQTQEALPETGAREDHRGEHGRRGSRGPVAHAS